MLASCHPGEIAVERWIERSLREQHAADVREPIPDALLKLLRKGA